MARPGVVNRTETSDTARYITGGLYTLGKRHISYGKVEVRARPPLTENTSESGRISTA